MITGADPFRSISRISADAFAAVVRERAARAVVAERDASEYHAAALAHAVDPLLLAAMFNHESGMGRAGVARETHSWGNTRLPSFGVDPVTGADGEPVTVPGRTGVFPVYVSWLDGAISTVARLASDTWPPAAPYGDRTTIRGIFDHPSKAVWAPAGDLNDPHGYLASVLAFMNEHTDQEQPIGPPVEGATMPLPFTVHDRLTPVNYTVGRGGHVVTAIVEHITDGDTAAGAISWFHNPTSKVSAHYVLDRDGTVYACVEEVNTAWANGVMNQPNTANPIIAGWERDGVNPNSETVSIEAVGKPNQGWTTAQLAVGDVLTRDIARRWRVPISATTIIGHRDLDSVNRARCPSLTPAQWAKLRLPTLLTDDQKLEAVWRQGAEVYGDKLYTGQLDRPYYVGKVLRCTHALLTPDGRNLIDAAPGGILDDVQQWWSEQGVLQQY